VKLWILDTSVLVDQLRTDRYRERIRALEGIVRLSAVVLAELLRGASTAAEWDFLDALEQSGPVLTPTKNNWLESGRVLARMHEGKGFSPEKLRDLHFDVLIALTARSFGATVITSNRIDFETIRSYRDFELEIW
jgi:predicted nucleic acid-binding protein